MIPADVYRVTVVAPHQTEETMVTERHTFNYADKIQSLLANAEDESLSEQTREAYRAKAEMLMRKYRIEEEELLATDEAASSPVSRKIRIVRDYEGNAFGTRYVQIFGEIMVHTGCRFRMSYDINGPVWDLMATVVGYDGDVRYAEFLWTAALLTFSTRIDPTWSNDRTEADNIFYLRNAGIERRKIADLAWGNGREASARSRVQRIYLKECARRGETAGASGLSHNTAVYREAYGRSFADTFRRRLQDAQDVVDRAEGGLVLHGRSGRVDEAFYTLFPMERPVPRTPGTYVTVTEDEPCKKCEKAKSGSCREHAVKGWTRADETRWNRAHNSPAARAGTSSGRTAAEDVIVSRVGDAVHRIED